MTVWRGREVRLRKLEWQGELTYHVLRPPRLPVDFDRSFRSVVTVLTLHGNDIGADEKEDVVYGSKTGRKDNRRCTNDGCEDGLGASEGRLGEAGEGTG
jgi:hypothetical protein